MRVPSWGGAARPSLVYDSPAGRTAAGGARKGRAPGSVATATYGGKLVENVVQAACRDLLAAALLACEREGLAVVLHVHDEIVCETAALRAERDLRRLAELMSSPPSWAEGLPVEVEGHAGERYLKSAPAGAMTVKARGGEVVAWRGRADIDTVTVNLSEERSEGCKKKGGRATLKAAIVPPLKWH